MKQCLVLMLLIVCLTLVVEGRRPNRRGGNNRRRNRVPHGPLCKVQASGGGSILYQDPDACVFDQQCQQSQVEAVCNGTQAVFFFCMPKFHFLAKACMINNRDLQRPNCVCSPTEYTIRSSATSSEITVRYCDRSALTDDDDDDDDDDEVDDLEDVMERRRGRPLLGTPSTFSLSQCARPGRRPGKAGRRPGRRHNREG